MKFYLSSFTLGDKSNDLIKTLRDGEVIVIE